MLLTSLLSPQVIGGSAARKYGGKSVLAMAVFLWSLSTIMVPFFAHSINALLISRVLLGLGEGLGKLVFKYFYIFIFSNVFYDKFSNIFPCWHGLDNLTGVDNPHSFLRLLLSVLLRFLWLDTLSNTNHFTKCTACFLCGTNTHLDSHTFEI